MIKATYLMLISIGLCSKLNSFHYVLADNRRLLKRIELNKNAKAINFGITEETFASVTRYPKNLRFGHYLRFVFAPTLCY